jgi:ribonuclease R
VQLKEFFIRGFLHVSYLTDDYYRFDERQYRLVGRHKRKAFTIGKRIWVRIERVDIDEREIVLALA